MAKRGQGVIGSQWRDANDRWHVKELICLKWDNQSANTNFKTETEESWGIVVRRLEGGNDIFITIKLQKWRRRLQQLSV